MSLSEPLDSLPTPPSLEHSVDEQPPAETPVTDNARSSAAPDRCPSNRGQEAETVGPDLAHSPLSSGWKKAFGTKDKLTAERLLEQVLDIIPGGANEKDPERCKLSILAMLRSIGPRDQLEALLAVQIVAAHHVAMEFLARGSPPRDPYQLDTTERHMKWALQLLRLYPKQMETLIRYREKRSSNWSLLRM